MSHKTTTKDRLKQITKKTKNSREFLPAEKNKARTANTKPICHFYIHNRCNSNAISSRVKMPVILIKQLQDCQLTTLSKEKNKSKKLRGHPSILMSCECKSINVQMNAAECSYQFSTASNVFKFTGIIWTILLGIEMHSFSQSGFTDVYGESTADNVFFGGNDVFVD